MLIFDPERCTKWAEEKLGMKFYMSTSMGVERNGELVAVCVYHRYNQVNMEVSFATTTPRWASRQNISSILWKYPFEQMKVKRLTAITTTDNDHARKFLEWLGFVQEGIHPDFFPHGDAVSYGLVRYNAERWK